MEADNDIEDQGYSNSAVVSGITGNTVQINVRYWVKTDLKVTDGKHRSEVVIEVAEVLNANGFIIK
ncbi:hypothetical protein EV143_106153 [Flavobacterium chryseum]|uniref:hypothetical protein n=1 Tax=Flavobacterium sp. P3160 TaxID=2512113 RepID=UPI0010DB38FB|nr:hypothetical protein [Flavobacterium sp. P3160]TDO73211.1 hypothetical protein EV143_106153 [Flavobacterium sp. P3160]